jgi:hypothetical protein
VLVVLNLLQEGLDLNDVAAHALTMLLLIKRAMLQGGYIAAVVRFPLLPLLSCIGLVSCAEPCPLLLWMAAPISCRSKPFQLDSVAAGNAVKHGNA